MNDDLSLEEQLDAYIVHLKDQGIVNDAMSFSEQVRVTSEHLLRWMEARHLQLRFNGPRKQEGLD